MWRPRGRTLGNSAFSLVQTLLLSKFGHSLNRPLVLNPNEERGSKREGASKHQYSWLNRCTRRVECSFTTQTFIHNNKPKHQPLWTSSKCWAKCIGSPLGMGQWYVLYIKIYNAKIDRIGLKSALTPISRFGLILGQCITNKCVYFDLRNEIIALHCMYIGRILCPIEKTPFLNMFGIWYDGTCATLIIRSFKSIKLCVGLTILHGTLLDIPIFKVHMVPTQIWLHEVHVEAPIIWRFGWCYKARISAESAC